MTTADAYSNRVSVPRQSNNNSNNGKNSQSLQNARIYAKTALHSSVIQHIAVCALRGEERKDIVFAKETVLELLEMTSDGTLVSLLEQPVFGTIKDMRVLHCNFYDSEAYIQEERTQDQEFSNQGKQKPQFESFQQAPPINGQDVLVFLSDSGILTFLSCSETKRYRDPNGKHRIVENTDIKGKRKDGSKKLHDGRLDNTKTIRRFTIVEEIALSPPGLDYQEIGRILCVDPLSRAIAVAAWQDKFKILMLNELDRQIFSPLKETHGFTQEGIIWHMDFLYPFPNDLDRVLLALIVFSDIEKQASIIIYEFWTTETSSNAKLYAKLPLAKDSPLPLNLIALPQYPESFLVVNEREAYFLRIEDVVSGNVNFHKVSVPQNSSGGEALFTAFALPNDLPVFNPRSPSPSASGQYLYAATEDGCLFRIDITPQYSIDFLHLGLVNPVACTMSVFPTDTDTVEYLILPGEMCDGAVVSVTQDFHIEQTWEIPNWAPILDFQMLDFHRERHDIIFTCSGRDKQGSIREIRRGIGVNVITTTGPDYDGITGLWNIKYQKADESDSFLAMSFASSSRLMYLGGGELDDISENSGLDLETRSLCVSSYNEFPGYLIQVHRGAVLVTKPKLDDIAVIQTARWQPDGNATIAVADIMDSIVVMSLSAPTGSSVVVLQISHDETSNSITFMIIGESPLDIQPCFIHCLQQSLVVPVPLCILGTYRPSLKFMSLDFNNCLALLHEEILSEFSVEGISIPESVSILGTERAYFLASLREGTVVYYQWLWSTEYAKPILLDPNVRHIGTLAAKLVYPTSSSAVQESDSMLVLSDRPWQVKITHTGLSFTCVSFDQFEHVQEATPFNYADFSNGYMFVSRNCLNFVHLDNFKKNNIRTIPIGETPRRLFYDDINKLLLVACISDKKPFPTSVLKLIDPMSGDVLSEHVLKDGEVVYAITDWHLPSQKSYLCVGTGIHKSEHDAPQEGRLLIFTVKKSGVVMDHASQSSRLHKPFGPNVKYELRKIYEKDRTGVVYSVCPFTENFLLISAGRTLLLLNLDLEKKKLVEVTSKLFRWPIMSINTHSGRVCVGTIKDSIWFCQYSVESKSLEVLRSDRYTKSIGDSMMLSENFVVASDKFGEVFALSNTPGDPNIERCLQPVFSFSTGEVIPRLRVGSLVYYSTDNPRISSASSQMEETSCSTSVATDLMSSSKTPLLKCFNSGDLGWIIESPNHSNSISPMSSIPQTNLQPLISKQQQLQNQNQQSMKKKVSTILGCSLLGSVFLFMRINQRTFGLLLVLQEILVKWESTRPILGNQHRRFRGIGIPKKQFIGMSNNIQQQQQSLGNVLESSSSIAPNVATTTTTTTNNIDIMTIGSMNYKNHGNVIDGEMVSQFLRLEKAEQKEIVEKYPELKNIVIGFLNENSNGRNEGQAVAADDINTEDVIEVYERILEEMNMRCC